MIVTCPNCTARLQLDGAKVPARPFSVRCPKCQQIINAQPPETPPARDALAAVGNVPATTRPQPEAASATPAPLVTAEATDRRARVCGRCAASAGVAAAARDARAKAVPLHMGRGRERRRALVCAGSAFGGDAVGALRRAGYDVSVAAEVAEAVERMREDHFDVLVLDPEFDARGQGALRLGRELTSMRTAERRRLVFVLLSNTVRTGDAHAAFLAGANLIISMKEVADLPRVLEKNISDLNELYRDFNKALGLAEL